MADITIRIVTRLGTLAEYIALIKRAPADLDKELRTRTIPALERDILPKYKAMPDKPKYPIQWQSAKQRRAYFATNGFGHGIPYRRSGQLEQNWELDARKVGAAETAIVVGNDTPYASYVIGREQQAMHANSGYPTIDSVTELVQQDVAEQLAEAWYSVVEGM
jgi:hypothetical protein